MVRENKNKIFGLSQMGDYFEETRRTVKNWRPIDDTTVRVDLYKARMRGKNESKRITSRRRKI
jgi:hypothetical protein